MAKKRLFFLILAGPKWKIPSEQNGSSDKLVNLRYAFFSPCPPAMQSDGPNGPSPCHSRPQSHSAYISCVDSCVRKLCQLGSLKIMRSGIIFRALLKGRLIVT